MDYFLIKTVIVSKNRVGQLLCSVIRVADNSQFLHLFLMTHAHIKSKPCNIAAGF